MGLAAKLLGRVSRMLPQSEQDTDLMAVRVGRYGDVWTIGGVRKQHGLADEGTYFVCNNAQTGIASPAGTAFAGAVAMMVLANTDSPSNQNAKRIHLDYMALITTAAGSFASAGVNLQAALYLDSGNRYTSGGSELSANIVNANMDVATRASVAKVYFGNLVTTAVGQYTRALVGQRILRPVVSGTVADVIGETKFLNFGGVEAMMNGSITVANANNIPIPMPPVIIGPSQCAVLHFWMNGTTPSAASYLPELGWWER